MTADEGDLPEEWLDEIEGAWGAPKEAMGEAKRALVRRLFASGNCASHAEQLGPAYERFLAKRGLRKRGGSFYTPTSIVDYIVSHTVAVVCLGKTPREVASLKIVDPACGGGIFLLRAYQYLLDWHLAWYLQNSPEQHLHVLTRDKDGGFRLSSPERKRILLGSVYGWDIDPRAVRLTEIALLLMALDGDPEATLPDLQKNLECSNFLRRSPGDGETQGELFDVVLGNPPYGVQHQDDQKDLYLLFLERYASILKAGGLLGVIVSNTWLQSVKLRRIRTHLASEYRWLRVLLIPEKVFDAVVDTHVIVFQKENGAPNPATIVIVDERKQEKIRRKHTILQADIPRNGDPMNVSAPRVAQELLRKIRSISKPLSELFDVYNGVKPFEKGKGTPPQTSEIVRLQPYVREGARPDSSWSPLLRGSLLRRYEIVWNNDYWIQYGPWLAAPRDPAIFSAPEKIMVRQTGDSIIATLVGPGFIARNNLHVVLGRAGGIRLPYLLGILNSRLMEFVYSLINPEKGEALAEVKKHHVEELPIRVLEDDIAGLGACLMHLVEKALGHEETALRQQIDAIVYQIYGLSKNEIALVEEFTESATAPPPQSTSRRVKPPP